MSKRQRNRLNMSGLPSYGWWIWGIAALFYGYEFIHRILPAAMLTELKFSFQVSDTTLGTFSAIYFWTYAIFQMPAGMLIDRFGSRRLLTLACLVVTIGSLLLITSNHIMMACFSRFLVGAGSAFAFVGCLKLGRQWFKPEAFPLVVGLTNLSAQLAAILGNRPLALWLETHDWQSVVLGISLFGALLTLALFALVRNHPDSTNNKLTESISRADFKQQVISIIKDRYTWAIAIYGCLIVSPIVAFGEFWGIHYLQEVYQLTRPDAAFLNSAIFIGIAMGGPTIGIIAKQKKHYQRMMRTCTLIALIALSTVLYLNTFSYLVALLCLFIYGLMSSNMLLCFSLINAKYSSHRQATAIGFTNTVIMFGGAFFPVIVGLVLDYITRLTPLAYQVPHANGDLKKALFILPVCLLCAFLMTFFFKQPD